MRSFQPAAEGFTGFALFARGREISFLFRNQESRPSVVLKRGERRDLEREYLNHRTAYALFPLNVPKIHSFEEEGTRATLCFEYVREEFLSNRIASTWVRKKRFFLKEVQRLFSFYIRYMETILSAPEAVKNRLSRDQPTVLFRTLIRSLPVDEEFARLESLAPLHSHPAIPLLFQHGDFCIRNILYDSGGPQFLIDWEDADPSHLPLLDFNMLTISLCSLYSQVFACPESFFFQEPLVRSTLAYTATRVQALLELSEEDFHWVSFLSKLSLYELASRRNRQKAAEEIFRHMAADLAALGRVGA